MFKSLRYRLLFWLLAFVFFTVSITIPVNSFFQKKRDRINHFVTEINLLNLELLKFFKASEDFLFIESSNPVFFITGESKYLDERHAIITGIQQKFKNVIEFGYNSPYPFGKDLDDISLEIENYNLVFDSLVYLIYKHGYNNFGLEGELIDYADALEKSYGLNKYQLLQIRRNEKDYFLKHDQFYIENFNRLFSGLIHKIKTNRILKSYEKEKYIQLAGDYKNSFHALVELKNKIGLTDNSGLKSQLNSKSSLLQSKFTKLITVASLTRQNLVRKLRIIYFIFMLIAISIAVAVSVAISKYILGHLENLTSYISKLTESNFSYNEKLDMKNPALEITKIYNEFRNMVAQLHIWERQRDKALRNSEESELRYRELADMLPQSIFETDELGNFTYVNKTWHKTFGYTKDDLKQGLNLIETVISESNDDILGNIKLENSNFVAIRKDGTRFPASVYSASINNGNSIVGKRGIIIDATERNLYINSLQKETTKARTSDKLKSSFLANMSHEIRTPMNSIIGFSNLMASEEIAEEQKKEFVNYIKSSSEMLLNLIDDIIDIAKIEAGEIKINKKECNISELFTDLYKTFEELRKRSEKNSLILVLNTGEYKEITIKTDPFRLRQIMTNLLSNALKFTENGSIDFGFMIRDDRKIEFFVRDTGVGLTREELGIIFERFKRAVKSEEKNISGKGLGLAISKNLVELMDGEMWVDSKPGVGTTFFFTLPFLKVAGSTSISSGQEISEVYNWSSKTILVVEDDLQSQYFLKELLKKTGVNLIQASNGFEAIELCKTNEHIDIVLMDIQMPKLNGYEATREIKKIRKTLPVIAQTAFAMSGDREKCILSGCDDYVVKPLSIDSLLPVIHHFLNKNEDVPDSKPIVNILGKQIQN